MKYDYSQALANITKIYDELNNIITDLDDSVTMDEVEKADKFMLERIIKRLDYAAEYVRSAKAIANVRSTKAIANR